MSGCLRPAIISVLLLVSLLATACTQAEPTATVSVVPMAPPAATATVPAPTPTAEATAPPTVVPSPTPDPRWASVAGIVDPTNTSFPREVRSGTAVVTIKAKPQRIHTVSLGLDEVAYALVPAQRVVAVARFTQDPGQSNVAEQSKQAAVVARDSEPIIAQNPDIVLASPTSNAALVGSLESAGILVVRVGLDNTAENRIQNILLMGYILGEEQRALQLAGEVQARVGALTALNASKPAAARTRVLSLTSFSGSIYTAGIGSTEGAIIDTAGGINAAAEAGVRRNPVTSLEGVIAMRPDVIFIPQPNPSAETFRQSLMAEESLKDVPAIKSGRVYVVEPKWFTTLSFWNVRGAEELAKILWPSDLGGKTFPPFSFPSS